MLRNAATMPQYDANKPMGDGVAGGLSPWPNALRIGLNSGYQALGLAIAAGASRCVLLGYDMHYPGGRTHWHGGHPNIHVPEQLYSGEYRKWFNSMAAALPEGVEVLNATPGSLVDSFPRVALEEIL